MKRFLLSVLLVLGLIGLSACASQQPTRVIRPQLIPYINTPPQLTNGGSSVTKIDQACHETLLNNSAYQCIVVNQNVGGAVAGDLHFTFPMHYRFYHPTGAVIMSYHAITGQPGVVRVDIPQNIYINWTNGVAPARLEVFPGTTITIVFWTQDQGYSWSATIYKNGRPM